MKGFGGFFCFVFCSFAFLFLFCFILFLIDSSSDHLVCQNSWEFYESHILGHILVFVHKKNSNLLHNSLWITFPTHSYILLYSFDSSLLHWIMSLFNLFHHICYSVTYYQFLHYYYYYHYFTPCEFPTSVNWGSFTGVWVTASLLLSPGVSEYDSRSFTEVWVTASLLLSPEDFRVY